MFFSCKAKRDIKGSKGCDSTEFERHNSSERRLQVDRNPAVQLLPFAADGHPVACAAIAHATRPCACGPEVRPGDNESGTMGYFCHRRPEHRTGRCMERVSA